MSQSPTGATIPEVTHHTTEVGGADLHYVTAGTTGAPVLLIHGFPESWWAFRGVIPALAAERRVIAVDLPGFGDSGHGPGEYTSTCAAESLHQLIEQLDLGPVHLTGQDIGGVSAVRLAAGHPELIRSFAGIETGLPGFGLELLADVTHGGTWHIGVMAAPGIPAMLLAGRERTFLADYAFPAMSAGTGAITEQDINEFTRAYAQPDGFRGATGLYRSMLAEGEEIRHIVASGKLTMPVLSVAAGTGSFTHQTMNQIAENVTEVNLTGIGHLVALEDGRALANTLLAFYRTLGA
jgi:pimeloyl-ACP methyl ester carboxylesterase